MGIRLRLLEMVIHADSILSVRGTMKIISQQKPELYWYRMTKA